MSWRATLAGARARRGAARPPAGAQAADPGRWTADRHDDAAARLLPGRHRRSARATSTSTASTSASTAPTPAFTETGRNDDVIPPDVHLREGYNHIGDITWDRQEGGRILLPLECYVPGGPNGGNPCRTRLDRRRRPGHAAVALLRQARPGRDPEGDVERGLARRHAAVDVERRSDLLAYRTADISRAQRRARARADPLRAAAATAPCPPSGITGATFIGERLFVAGQGGGPFRVWSIDLATGARRLEIERRIVGESEGLVTASRQGRRRCTG